MSACEECWVEASRKALVLGGFTAEHYLRELDAHPEHEAEVRSTDTTEGES